ncbi:primosomal protein [Kocuria marina]|uniref:primosomal protein n=1 Tax=Kocuria marina TaxID=223184 RepID=UPI003460CB12
MSTDPRAALQALVNALEEHLAAAANRRSDDDPTVDGAYLAIANTFEAYEEALYDAYDEVTPLTVFAEEDDSDDDLDYDDDDDDDDLLEDNEMMDEDLIDEDDYDDDENEDRDSSNGRRSGR